MKNCRLSVRLSIAALTFGLGGCGNNATSPVFRSTIAGVVRNAAGQAVPTASVKLETIVLGDAPAKVRGACSGSTGLAVTVTSGANGAYSVSFVGKRPAHLCIFVDAAATIAGTPVTGVAEADSVWLGAPPIDVIQLDVIVRN
jgi:hypothetical protein